MIKISEEDKKLVKWFVGGIVIYILFCLVIVESDIPSKASNDGWLAFFGGLGGGAIAIFGVYITLQHNRKLMDESHQKQMDLMLGQIRTQFWMEKFSEAIIVLENINDGIIKYVGDYNRMDSGEVDTDTKFDTMYLFNVVKEVNKNSYTLHPKLIRDENLYKKFWDFKNYITKLRDEILANYDYLNNNKKINSKIKYDMDPYIDYLVSLTQYADPIRPHK